MKIVRNIELFLILSIYLNNLLKLLLLKLICAHSNVNRSTFYANFKDKYNLYDIIQNYHKKKYINLLDTLYNDFEDVKSNNMKIHKFL